MRSMVEGAITSAAAGTRPLHRLRRSPSPASRVRNRRVAAESCVRESWYQYEKQATSIDAAGIGLADTALRTSSASAVLR